MAYEEEIEQTITGRTYEECKEKLFNTYGKDFRITDKKIDFRPGGFLYLKKKNVLSKTSIYSTKLLFFCYWKILEKEL